MIGIPPSPALSDKELRETLDMLGTVVASVSDRVDAQTEVLARVNKTATEARQAAFAARAQTDPKKYGDLVGEAINDAVGETVRRTEYSANALDRQTDKTNAALNRIDQDKWAIVRELRAREVSVERFKGRLPWFVLGAVVLALAMTLLLPRFLASNSSACAVIGGQWTKTTTGGDACVFYERN